MKKNLLLIVCLSMLALVLLLTAGICVYEVGRDIYEEVTFYDTPRTQAEYTVKNYAEQHGIPYCAYPDSLIALLERNPETETFVLEYPQKKDSVLPVDLSEYADCQTVPLFMQWDPRWGYMRYGSDVAGLTGCGPVCLSMAAYYLTKDPAMSPDNLLRFALRGGYCVPGNGTSWTLISEGGRKLGLEVEELPLDKGRILSCLEAGTPVICVMGPGYFTTSGHFIVLAGCSGDMLRVNDPNSYANSEKLWAYEDICGQIRNLWAIGP